MKNFTLGLATAYLFTAILFGGAGRVSLPRETNWKGIVYYGAIWPAWPLSAAFNRLLVPIPSWGFTFSETGK
jgi:hypothetical protein